MYKRQAFEFKGDGAEGLGARGYGATGEGFEGLTIGGGVADGGVAGKRFHVMDGARMGAAGKRAFDAAMLIAEGDFQVQNFFAVALEAEMAGLDDAGMDGADGDFVGLPAGNAEEIADGGRDGRGWVALPGVAAGTIGWMVAQRFEPRVAGGDNAPLLGNFALEDGGLRTFRGKRGIGITNGSGQQAKLTGKIASNQGDQMEGFVVLGDAHKGGDAFAVGDRAQNNLPKFRYVEYGQMLPEQRLALAQDGGNGAYGTPPFRSVAAAARTPCRRAGIHRPSRSDRLNSASGGQNCCGSCLLYTSRCV